MVGPTSAVEVIPPAPCFDFSSPRGKQPQLQSESSQTMGLSTVNSSEPLTASMIFATFEAMVNGGGHGDAAAGPEGRKQGVASENLLAFVAIEANACFSCPEEKFFESKVEKGVKETLAPIRASLKPKWTLFLGGRVKPASSLFPGPPPPTCE